MREFPTYTRSVCLMVWLGTACPIPAMGGKEPDAELGHACVEPTPADAEIRRNVPSAFVTYVGSHEGCGCGFNSSMIEFYGIDDEASLAPLLGALLDDERAEYERERRSRAQLHRLISAALPAGPVIVYACWAGAEAEPPEADERVDAAWLLRQTAPLKERVRYTVTG